MSFAPASVRASAAPKRKAAVLTDAAAATAAAPTAITSSTPVNKKHKNLAVTVPPVSTPTMSSSPTSNSGSAAAPATPPPALLPLSPLPPAPYSPISDQNRAILEQNPYSSAGARNDLERSFLQYLPDSYATRQLVRSQATTAAAAAASATTATAPSTATTPAATTPAATTAAAATTTSIAPAARMQTAAGTHSLAAALARARAGQDAPEVDAFLSMSSDDRAGQVRIEDEMRGDARWSSGQDELLRTSTASELVERSANRVAGMHPTATLHTASGAIDADWIDAQNLARVGTDAVLFPPNASGTLQGHPGAARATMRKKNGRLPGFQTGGHGTFDNERAATFLQHHDPVSATVAAVDYHLGHTARAVDLRRVTRGLTPYSDMSVPAERDEQIDVNQLERDALKRFREQLVATRIPPPRASAPATTTTLPVANTTTTTAAVPSVTVPAATTTVATPTAAVATTPPASTSTAALTKPL